MCLVVFIASRSPLPAVPWTQEAPAFNVGDLSEQEGRVRRHLLLPHIRYAGSHTQCGCGFNEGREYPETVSEDAGIRAASLESSARLARYVREHHVEQLYSCWSGDEAEPQDFARRITPDELAQEGFFFRERELFIVSVDAE